MACITKRGDRYVIDCYDQNGKRYRKTMKEGTTKKEGREKLAEIEKKIGKGSFIHEKKAKTFSEVADLWIEYKKPKIRITSWEVMRGQVNNHFEELNDIRIDRINTATIEKWISAREQARMNLNTLRRIITTLNQVMAYAVRHRMIDTNPVRDAERPKKRLDDAEAGEQFRILQPEQIRALLDAVEDRTYRLLFMAAILTGARQGELLGLKWLDVKFEKKQIHIRRSFNHGKFFAPKTRESMRSIDIAPVLLRELAEWKLLNGMNGEYVFSSATGTPLFQGNILTRHFWPALKKAKLPKMRFHDLRHTYASMLIHQGENIKYIQSQLGHSSPIVTMTVYAHLMKKENQEAVCKLENTIFQGMVTK